MKRYHKDANGPHAKDGGGDKAFSLIERNNCPGMAEAAHDSPWTVTRTEGGQELDCHDGAVATISNHPRVVELRDDCSGLFRGVGKTLVGFRASGYNV